MKMIGNVVALRELIQLVVDLVQSEEKRGSTTRRCEDCLLLDGLVQDASIVVVLAQLQDSLVAHRRC